MPDYPYMVLSALAAVLNVAPFCWQVEHRNSGPVCLGFWVILLNLNQFVNAVVWRNDAINRAPAWCDLSSKISIGGPVGLLAANVCITRFLARVVRPSAKIITARERRNNAIFDYCFSFACPIFVMATHVIYQPIRFGIAKTIGCQFAFFISWPTFLLWMIWSPILALTAAIYAIYVMLQLLRHRRNFGRLVANADSALTTSRFVRLVLLSGAYALFTLPLSIYQFTVQMDVGGQYKPYNWTALHRGLSHGVVYYAGLVEHAAFENYTAIISGILVLVFFGFGSESLNFYARLFSWLPLKRLVAKRGVSKTKSIVPVAIQLRSERVIDDGSTASKDLEKDGWQGPLETTHYNGPFANANQQHDEAEVALGYILSTKETPHAAHSFNII